MYLVCVHPSAGATASCLFPLRVPVYLFCVSSKVYEPVLIYLGYLPFLTSYLCINLCLIINNYDSDFVLSLAFESETFIYALNMYSNLFCAPQRHLLIHKMFTNASQELLSFSSASLYHLDGKNALKCKTTRFRFSCIQLKHGI